MGSESSRAMFEQLKDCADRINDQLGPHKAFARSESVDRVCTENLIRVDDVMESPKLAE
jgi:hypothetical protein